MCDGCGKCCLHKLEDEVTGELHADQRRLPPARPDHAAAAPTTSCGASSCPIACGSTRPSLREIDWLPSTCAYRLRAEGKPLPDWHYLISGDRETVHRAGMSVRGWTVSEDEAGDLEHHLVDREL